MSLANAARGVKSELGMAIQRGKFTPCTDRRNFSDGEKKCLGEDAAKSLENKSPIESTGAMNRTGLVTLGYGEFIENVS